MAKVGEGSEGMTLKSLKTLARVEGESPPQTPPRVYARTRGACGASAQGFSEPPTIGTIVKLDEQVYECCGTTPHTRIDGTPTTLTVWESACASCGDAFTCKAPVRSLPLTRRCSKCAKPGKPVKGRRGRRIKVEVHHA